MLGLRLQLAALAAAILLGIYGASMTTSLPAAEQFHYSVFVLAASMLTLATLVRSPLTIDALIARFQQLPATADPASSPRSKVPHRDVA